MKPSSIRSKPSLAEGAFADKIQCVIPPPTLNGKDLKFFSQNLTTNFSSISTTPTALGVGDLVAQGTDYNQRLGRSFRAVGLLIEGTLVGGQSNLATDDAYNTVRIACCWCDSGANFSSWGISSALDPRVVTDMGRPLYHEAIVLQSPGLNTVGYMQTATLIGIWIPLNGLVRFNTAAAGSQSGLGPSVIMVSDSTAVSHPGFTSGQIRLFFVDA
jgi:hypothetical protein